MLFFFFLTWFFLRVPCLKLLVWFQSTREPASLHLTSHWQVSLTRTFSFSQPREYLSLGVHLRFQLVHVILLDYLVSIVNITASFILAKWPTSHSTKNNCARTCLRVCVLGRGESAAFLISKWAEREALGLRDSEYCHSHYVFLMLEENTDHIHLSPVLSTLDLYCSKESIRSHKELWNSLLY